MKKLENPTPTQLRHREYMKEYYHSRMFNHVCKSCEKPFTSKNYRAKFCYSGCSTNKKVTRICEHCKSTYSRNPAYSKKPRFCSRACMGKFRIGPLSPQWKGGKSTERETWQGSPAHQVWRKAVLERDGYTCQDCGISKVAFQVHHIKPWAYFPELRANVDNGQTLCVDCHKATDTYGSKAKLFAKTLTTREVF